MLGKEPFSVYESRSHSPAVTRSALRGALLALLVLALVFGNVSFLFAEGEDAPAKAEIPAPPAEAYKDVPVTVNGKEAAVYCLNTQSFVYNKNMEVKVYPASTTKILTAIVAIEEGNYAENSGKKITVSHDAVFGIPRDSSHIALREGEVVTFKDLMHGMLLASGNDCAVAIAEYVGGSVEDYAKLMNEKAKEIGCTGTHYVNPNGLYSEEHFTTCRDLALMLAYAVSLPDFVKISSAITYDMPKTNKAPERTLWNNHRMVETKYAYYPPIVCGKSGYVEESLYNLTSYGKKDGLELIVVTAGCADPDLCTQDTRALMDYYFDNYEAMTVSAEKAELTPVTVGKKEVPVTAEGDRTLLVKKGTKSKDLSYVTKADEGMELPVHKGDVVGTVTIKNGDEVVTSFPVTASETVRDTGAILFKVFLLLLFSGIGVIVFFSLKKSARRRRRKRFRNTR